MRTAFIREARQGWSEDLHLRTATKTSSANLALIAMLLSLGAMLFYSNGYYYSSDDMGFAYMARTAPDQIDEILLPVGRWLNSFLIRSIFSHVDSIADLAWVRAGTAALLILFGLAFSRLLVRLNACSGVVPFVATAAILTPSSMTMVSWSQHVSVVFGSLLMLAAAWLVLEVEATTRSRFYRSLCLILSSVLMYAAASINQLLLGFAGTFTFIVLYLAPNRKVFFDRICCICPPTAAAYLASYITVRLYSAPGSRSTLAPDLIASVIWFVKEPLANVGRLIFLIPETPHLFAYIVILFCSTVIAAAAGDRRLAFARSLAFLVCLPVSYLPNILVAEKWASYRTVWPMSVLVTTAFLLTTLTIVDRFEYRRVREFIGFLTVVGIGGLWCYHFERYERAPLTEEAEYVLTAFARLQASERGLGISTEVPLYVVVPSWTENLPNRGFYDDVGGPATRIWSAAGVLYYMSRQKGFQPISFQAVKPVAAEERAQFLRTGKPFLDLSNYAGRSHLYEVR